MKIRLLILPLLLIFILSCSTSKKSAKSTATSPIDRWMQQQNKEYLRLIQKYPHEFKTLGVGIKPSFSQALSDAKFNSTVLMPEKIGMIIQTLMVSSDGNNDISHQSGATVRANHIKHEELGRINYNNKVYVCVVSSLDKNQYFNDLATQNTLNKINSDALSVYKSKVLKHNISGGSASNIVDDEVRKWTEKCEISHNKWKNKNTDFISAEAWAYDNDPKTAFNKAKLVAGSLLPEKVEVYVEIITQSLTKMGYSQREITQTRINSLSKSKLSISNMISHKNQQFKHNGKYYVSVIACKPKKDFDSIIRNSLKNDTQVPEHFFENAGDALHGYY